MKRGEGEGDGRVMEKGRVNGEGEGSDGSWGKEGWPKCGQMHT